MSESELKPCPFCGEAPLLHTVDWCEPVEHVVSCFNADCGRQYSTPAEAIAAWNKRVPVAKDQT